MLSVGSFPLSLALLRLLLAELIDNAIKRDDSSIASTIATADALAEAVVSYSTSMSSSLSVCSPIIILHINMFLRRLAPSQHLAAEGRIRCYLRRLLAALVLVVDVFVVVVLHLRFSFCVAYFVMIVCAKIRFCNFVRRRLFLVFGLPRLLWYNERTIDGVPVKLLV